MLDMATFDFDEDILRVIDRDGEPWFVAKDLCRILDLENVARTVSRLDEDERGVTTVNTPGGNQEMTIVSESGLYALIFTSRKPEAKRFRKWVTSEVLPSIRRTGRYEGAPPRAHPAPRADMQDMPARDRDFWLAATREARILAGPRAARRLWDKSPLPPIPDPDVEDCTDFGEDDEIIRFFTECVTVTGHAADFLTARALIRACNDWLIDQGYTQWGPRGLSLRIRALADAYIDPETGRRFRPAKQKVTGYAGLRLKSGVTPPDPVTT